MGNYQDSDLKHEYNLNAINLHERFSNAKIKCIFDAQSGKIIKMNQDKLNKILTNPDFYYHGTSECSAFSIVCDGLQEPKEFAHRGHYLGNGLFVADNINHSLAYGSCIFVCYVRFKSTLELTFETDRKVMFDMIDTVFKKYETVKCVGRYDRYGLPNKTENGENVAVHPSFKSYFTPNFNEYRIKTVSNIVPKYLIKFDNTVGLRDENQIIRFVKNYRVRYQTFCIYDNSEYQKFYDGLEHESEQFKRLNAEIKRKNYFYVPIFFCEALEFLRSVHHIDVCTLQNNIITKKTHDYKNFNALLEYLKFGLPFYTDMSVLPNKYLAACHLRDNYSGNKITSNKLKKSVMIETYIDEKIAYVINKNAPKLTIICDYILIRSNNEEFIKEVKTMWTPEWFESIVINPSN